MKRLTIKRAMLLVALVALSLGIPLEVNRLTKLRAHYLASAAQHERWEEINRKVARGSEERLAWLQSSGGDAAEIDEARRTIASADSFADQVARRAALFRRLASHPWENMPEPNQPNDGPVLIFQTPSGSRLEVSGGVLARFLLAVVPLGGLALFAGRKRLFPGKALAS